MVDINLPETGVRNGGIGIVIFPRQRGSLSSQKIGDLDVHFKAADAGVTGDREGVFHAGLKPGFDVFHPALDGGEAPVWTRDEDGLHIQAAPGDGGMPVVFRAIVG